MLIFYSSIGTTRLTPVICNVKRMIDKDPWEDNCIFMDKMASQTILDEISLAEN